jgi:AhpD family alkylhydroperoxidase
VSAGSAPAPRITPGLSAVSGLSRVVGRLSGRVAHTEPPKLFLAIGRRPSLLVGWLLFAGRLMPGGALPRRETEIVILRVAHLTGCDYERRHHERIGRHAGLSPEQIEQVAGGSDARGWSARERILLECVDELHERHDLGEASYSALSSHLTEGEIVEFLMLVGHYQMLAQLITTLRLPPDTPWH